MADTFLKMLRKSITGGGKSAFRLATSLFGYAVGGTVTQATSKSTGVTLNATTGEVTMNNAALNAGVSVSFAIANTFAAAGDYASVQHVSGGTLGSYVVSAVCTASTITVTVTNRTAGNLSEAIVVKFILWGAANS